MLLHRTSLVNDVFCYLFKGCVTMIYEAPVAESSFFKQIVGSSMTSDFWEGEADPFAE